MASAPGPEEAGPPGEVRAFRVGDEQWLVFACGRGVAGSDGFAGLAIQSLRFARADQPGRPIIETLTARIDPFNLFDEELAALLAAGVRIEEDESRPPDRTDPGRRPGGQSADRGDPSERLEE